MNRVYRSLWNAALGSWVAVPETTRSRGRSSGSARQQLAVAALTAFAASPALSAVTGSGTVDPMPSGTSAWNIQNVTIGQSAAGSVTAGSADSITVSAQTVIGSGTAGNGTLTLNGGTFTTSTMYVGQEGDGLLQVNSGTVDVLSKIWVGDPTGSGTPTGKTGTVNLSGNGSSMTTRDEFAVGNNAGGIGNLNIASSATLNANKGLSFGNSAGSTGNGAFTGQGTVANISGGQLSVGNAGVGQLTVSAGAELNAEGVLVGNAGAGNGTLQINGGANVTSNDRFAIGASAGATGLVSVSGVGTTLTTNAIGDVFYLGNAGTGTFTADDNAVIESKSFVRIGSDLGGVGVANITGGANWQVSQNMFVGAAGKGTIEVTGLGTEVTVQGETYIGYDDRQGVNAVDQSEGTLLVNAGTFNAGSILTMGNFSNTQATIENGGIVNAGELRIGNTAAGSAVMDVRTGSTVNASSGTTFVGNAGQGSLTVASNSLMSGIGAVIGAQSTGDGDATINDGATWRLSGDLIVASSGQGDLTINNGGRVSSATGTIARRAGSTGVVTLSGGDAQWIIADNQLSIGEAGNGTLNLLDHDLTLTTITMGQEATGNGILNINDNTVTLDQLIRGDGGATFNVSGGTLRSSASQSEFVSAGTVGVIGSNGFTLDNQGFDIGFNASLSGAGDVLFTGFGDVIVGGNGSSYTGNTIIDGGMLSATVSNAFGNGGSVQVGGTQNALLYLTSNAVTLNNAVNVQSNSTLAGYGAINGNITLADGAVIEPGLISRDPQELEQIAQGLGTGTLTINGDLTFGNNATYEVHTSPSNGGQSDFIQVNGLAVLNGGRVHHVGDSASFALGQSYHILNATGGLQGRFSTLDSDFAFLNVALDHQANDVYLSISRKSAPNYSDYGKTPNQKEVGNALEGMNPNDPLFNDVDRVTKSQASDMLNSLTGEVHAQVLGSLGGLAGAIGKASADNLRSNLADAREACQGSSETLQQRVFDQSSDCSSVKPFWVEAQGSWAHAKTDGNAAQRKQDSKGIYFGADQALGDDGWRLGGAFGYSQATVKVNNNNSKSTVDSYSAAFYSGKSFAHGVNRVNLLGGVSYTHHQISSDRWIPLVTQTDKVKTDYNAHTAQAFAEASYTFDSGDYHIEPFAGLNVSRLKSNSFKEKGSAAALRSNAEAQTRTSSTLGVRSYTSVDIADVEARLFGSLGWKRALDNRDNQRDMAFVSGSNEFSIAGIAQAKNSAVVDLQAELGLSQQATLSVAYSGEFASKSRENAASLTLRWDF